MGGCVTRSSVDHDCATTFPLHRAGLVPVGRLRGRLVLPSYQRGYRWKRVHVQELLTDLAAFAAGPADGRFYFLQPVVVCGSGERWELVDGQQRLTTLYLVGRVLRRIAGPAAPALPEYTLAYETRQQTGEFLATFDGALGAVDPEAVTVDAFHLRDAAQTIEEWAADNPAAARSVLELICERDPAERTARVMWYPVERAAQADPRNLFSRLNEGRIPLTDAELVRAVLLGSSIGADEAATEGERRRMAAEWDAIEKRLHDDEYWAFLCEGDATDHVDGTPRMDHLFRVLYQRDRSGSRADGAAADVRTPNASNQHAVFQHIHRRILQEGPGPFWDEFRLLTATLETWWADRELRHLVGFLVATAGRDGDAVKLLSQLLAKRHQPGCGRQQFAAEVRERCWRRVAGKGLARPVSDVLAGLHYGQRAQVRATLLLFNVLVLLHRKDGGTFSFHAFRTGKWDIEHVHPKAGGTTNAGKKAAWAQVILADAGTVQQLGAPELKDRLRALTQDDVAEGDSFKAIYEAVRARFGGGEEEDGDAINRIGNLVLLNSRVNQSIGNQIFSIKRTAVIRNDLEGAFVPPATRNVFLKYYTHGEAPNLYTWSRRDQRAYVREMTVCFERFRADPATRRRS